MFCYAFAMLSWISMNFPGRFQDNLCLEGYGMEIENERGPYDPIWADFRRDRHCKTSRIYLWWFRGRSRRSASLGTFCGIDHRSHRPFGPFLAQTALQNEPDLPVMLSRSVFGCLEHVPSFGNSSGTRFRNASGTAYLSKNSMVHVAHFLWVPLTCSWLVTAA